MIDEALAALDAVTSALPAAELRPGQRDMTAQVAEAIETGRHLVVQAGTGTGKTLAYLVPAITSGKRVVVATATKALQDQLATKDLPFLAEQLSTNLNIDFDWAVLKGRNNYVCLQRLREFNDPKQSQLELDDVPATTRVEIKRISEWAGQTRSGDQAELDWSPSEAAWRAVSVGSDECPGSEHCPKGNECFAEQARWRAQASDVIVVNTHLYGLNVAAGGAILPEHDVVVFDEAHVLEDIISDTVGVDIHPGRFLAVASSVRRILDDSALVGSISEISSEIREALSPLVGARLGLPLPDAIVEILGDAQIRLARVGEVIQALPKTNDDANQRALRAQMMINRTREAIDIALASDSGSVTFVSGSADSPRLEVAALDVGPRLREAVWDRRIAVLTSATIPTSLPQRVGLPEENTSKSDVGSPFDYANNALLYCAAHMPDPRSPEFADAVNDELAALINAAGGRTLALFTSWKAMDQAADALRQRVSLPILTQRDLPKPALIKAFAESEETCLLATAGLFQGVDVPGRTLSLVVIDKIPFARPDDPLLSARRELLGRAAFNQIDVPRAATMLAQACGRLIRNATDRGVVAVLDTRLSSAGYRWDIVNALPPMKRTKDRAEVESFLKSLHESETPTSN